MRLKTLVSSCVFALGMNAQSIVFESSALRLPAISEGDTTSHPVTFRFTNSGKEPLTIAKVTPTCGCTKVTYFPRKAVPAGRRDSVVVEYKSDRSPGTIDEPLFVYSNKGDKRPLATLHVLGEVKESSLSQWRHLPAQMGPLRLKRKELVFGEDDVVLCIPCANTGPATLKVVATLLPPYVTLKTEPASIAPNSEADIVVRVDRNRLPKTHPVRSAIVLDGIPCDISQRRINLTIK